MRYKPMYLTPMPIHRSIMVSAVNAERNDIVYDLLEQDMSKNNGDPEKQNTSILYTTQIL